MELLSTSVGSDRAAFRPGNRHRIGRWARFRKRAGERIQATLKTKNNSMAAFCGVLLAFAVATPRRLMAQAASGTDGPATNNRNPLVLAAGGGEPKPPVIQSRTTLDGAWRLNRSR